MKRNRWHSAFWLGIMAVAVAKAWPADDWPQFRGPTGDGIAVATNLPLTWSATQNVAWKVPVPGRGRSSPVLLGDRIWLTTAVETGLRTFAEGPDRIRRQSGSSSAWSAWNGPPGNSSITWTCFRWKTRPL
jgi:hypothetical protein